MIYLCAGLFAEGRTDYDLLLPLISRLLDEIGARVCRGSYDVGATVGIDAPSIPYSPRAERIARAIEDHWDQCTLFVVHADGEGDPERALTERVRPGIELARASMPAPMVCAPCIPVREIEAWMLADKTVFEELGARDVALPPDPERVLDPKALVGALLASARTRRSLARYYGFFGERMSLERLRGLPRFNAFERDLETAVRELAGHTP